MTLAFVLAARCSRPRPYPSVGSLVLEQASGMVESDSASLAELDAGADGREMAMSRERCAPPCSA